MTATSESAPFAHDAAAVWSVAFSPDGSLLASADEDGAVRIRDLRTGEHRAHLAGHAGGQRSVAFSPDGTQLASAGEDGVVRVWDPRTGEHRTDLVGRAGSRRSVAFSPVNAILADGDSDGIVRLWDTSDSRHYRALGTFQCGSAVWTVAVSPDGITVATGNNDGSIQLWNMADSARIQSFGPPLKGSSRGAVYSVAFSRERRILASGGADGGVWLWDVTDPEHPRVVRSALSGSAASPVWSVALSPDGARLASGGQDTMVRLWDTRTGERSDVLADHAGAIWSVAFSPDGAALASGGQSGDVQISDVPGSSRRSTWRQGTSWRDALKPIPGVFDWYKGNVAAGTLFLGVFLVLKCYALAKADLTTALGILQYAGITNVVIAGLLSALPILAAAMLAFTVYRVIGRWQTAGRRRHGRRQAAPPATAGGTTGDGPLWAVMGGSAVLCALFTPWTIMAISAAFGGILGLGQRILSAAQPPRGVRKPLTWLAILAVVAWTVIGLVTALYTVWLPHEIVAFTPGPNNQPPRQQTGYVLTEGDGWITILTSLNHQLVRYPDGSVKSFTVCERFPHGGWSEISDATTLWREIPWPSFLAGMRTASNKGCPG